MDEILKWLPKGASFSGQRGSNLTDILQGFYDHDVLFGGGGDDALIGDHASNPALGLRDILIGGRGSDQFYFASTPNPDNVDVIIDFKPGTDAITFDRDAFYLPGIAPDGHVQGDQFRYGRSPADEDDYVMYRKKSGALFVDPDGTGAAPTVQAAILANKAKIDADDFLVLY